MADKKTDCSGLRCPMPIVKTTQGIKDIEMGQTLEVLATDPGFEKDIQAWSNKTGNKLVSFSKENNKFIALIEKV